MPTTTYAFTVCPACSAADPVEVASREDVVDEVEQLWAFHLRRLRRGAAPQQLTDRIAFSQDPPLRVVRCTGCGTVYRNPRERGRDVLRLYAEEPLDTAVLETLRAAQRATYRAQAARLARYAGERGAGVELGSYVGGFLSAAAERGWDFEGLDVNADAVAFLRAHGLRAQRGTLDETRPARRYDAVAIWNCFDQLPEPRATAAAARGWLRPGGMLAVRAPNGGFYAALRPHLAGRAAAVARTLLAYNNLLGFPYGVGFTPASLAGLLEEHGFEVVATVGDALVPLPAAHARRWAVWEERLLKRLLRAAARRPAAAPWFEVYARLA